jgi:hypothetical protein
MSLTVCLTANTLDYPEGGGHLWVHLNWALGLRALGCRVLWLEPVPPGLPAARVQAMVAALKPRLQRYGLAEGLALCGQTAEPLAPGAADGCLDLDAAAAADLLLDLRYDLDPGVVGRFRRTAQLDIDPGGLQIWISKGELRLPRHDVYFTIGETVGRPGARFPDCGLPWQYTPPCVALDWRPPRWAAKDAPFTTVAHWYDGWMADDGEGYVNGKRSGFLPFFDLPRRTAQILELATDLLPDDEDQVTLWDKGWRLRDAAAVSAGEIDLAALTEEWPERIVGECEQEYKRARWPRGAPADFGRTLCAARLYLFLRWLADHPSWINVKGSFRYFEQLRSAGERWGLIASESRTGGVAVP